MSIGKWLRPLLASGPWGLRSEQILEKRNIGKMGKQDGIFDIPSFHDRDQKEGFQKYRLTSICCRNH